VAATGDCFPAPPAATALGVAPGAALRGVADLSERAVPAGFGLGAVGEGEAVGSWASVRDSAVGVDGGGRDVAVVYT
jgi:hypothetical protein